MNEQPDTDLRISIQRLARRLRAERADDAVSDGQFSVLCSLAKAGSFGLAELSASERVTPPSMNRTVNALVDLGHVTRIGSPDDRRKVLITLTESGRTVIEATRRRRDAWLSARLDSLTVSQRAALNAAAPVLRELADQ